MHVNGDGGREASPRAYQTKEVVVAMKFWLDLRLATEAGETIKRHRVSGWIPQDNFGAFVNRLLHCLGEYSPSFECEEDRSQVGATDTARAAD